MSTLLDAMAATSPPGNFVEGLPIPAAALMPHVTSAVMMRSIDGPRRRPYFALASWRAAKSFFIRVPAEYVNLSIQPRALRAGTEGTSEALFIFRKLAGAVFAVFAVLAFAWEGSIPVHTLPTRSTYSVRR